MQAAAVKHSDRADRENSDADKNKKTAVRQQEGIFVRTAGSADVGYYVLALVPTGESAATGCHSRRKPALDPSGFVSLPFDRFTKYEVANPVLVPPPSGVRKGQRRENPKLRLHYIAKLRVCQALFLFFTNVFKKNLRDQRTGTARHFSALSKKGKEKRHLHLFPKRVGCRCRAGRTTADRKKES